MTSKPAKPIAPEVKYKTEADAYLKHVGIKGASQYGDVCTIADVVRAYAAGRAASDKYIQELLIEIDQLKGDVARIFREVNGG